MSAELADRTSLDPRSESLPVPLIGGWVPRRGVVVAVASVLLTLALAVVALGLGDLPLSPAEVVHALFATDGGFTTTVVRDWRLPRVLVEHGGACSRMRWKMGWRPRSGMHPCRRWMTLL